MRKFSDRQRLTQKTAGEPNRPTSGADSANRPDL
jgi:hypothetical protein